MPRRRRTAKRRKRRTVKRRSKKGRRLGKRQMDIYPSTGDYVYGDMHRMAKKIKTSLGGSSSYTASRKDDDQWSMTQEDGIKYKTINITYKKSKIGRLTQRLTSPGNLYDYATGGGASTQGRQAVTDASAFNGGDFNTLFQGLNNGVAITAIKASNQLFVKQVKHEMEFNNAGPTTLEMDVYILIDKNTGGAISNPLTIWDAALNSETNLVDAIVEAKNKPWLKPTTLKLFWFYPKSIPKSIQTSRIRDSNSTSHTIPPR
ncbi:putative capsid protein [Woodlouse hunter spider associated circular virus 1]|uniref:putative capsid protein n=1 Tax=Woodlouse hunter spider associated circular virus 1 TaxID=2293310 RepID=UPI000E332F88|nr:putative capsid protein [Woodlouse hunter spider associated circular virus 1]AXL65941.1 putative capsid protein [Woodlouse hunter spider associated circular virus 1]